MGRAALDRSGGLNKVDAIANVFNEKSIFRLAIAPEGTRKKVTELRTGFYYIAHKANVPIIPCSFDYRLKQVSIGNPFLPTGNIEADFKEILVHFKGVTGKIHENSFIVE
jgi:1-acyl-sn-glycerol-3-phosphate acyltransferase